MAPPRKKAEKMDLSSFLGDASIFNSLIVGGGAWSDDIDLPTAPASSYDRPSAPTSNLSHQQSSHHQQSVSIDPSTVPNDPPFIAYVGNLAFDTSDQDLETFFKNAEIKGVRMIMDMETQRPKGYGYVEFNDRASLLSALQMNGEQLHKRNIRINVAEGRQRGVVDDAKFATNWRTKTPSGADRTFRDQFSDRSNAFGGTAGFSYNIGSDRNSHGRDSERSSSFGGDRRDSERTTSYGGGGGWGGGGPAFQKRDSAVDDRSFQRRQSEVRPSVTSTTAPSATVTTSPTIPSKPKPNPFGNAAPRDEVAIQKQLEERRTLREEQEKLKRSEEMKEKAKKVEEQKEKRAEEMKGRDSVTSISSSTGPTSRSVRDHDKKEIAPTGAGSWRKKSVQTSRVGEKIQTKESKPVVAKKLNNVFELLDDQ